MGKELLEKLLNGKKKTHGQNQLAISKWNWKSNPIRFIYYNWYLINLTKKLYIKGWDEHWLNIRTYIYLINHPSKKKDIKKIKKKGNAFPLSLPLDLNRPSSSSMSNHHHLQCPRCPSLPLPLDHGEWIVPNLVGNHGSLQLVLHPSRHNSDCVYIGQSLSNPWFLGV